MKRLVITNNPKVLANVKNDIVEYYSCDYMGVLLAVRDKVHLGYQLLSHPLSGSVKPDETPYKTVVLSAENSILDTRSLQIIEESIAVCKKLTKKINNKYYTDQKLKDFQLIDYDLIYG